MGTSSVELGDKRVVAAGGADVPRPEINGVAEVAGDMDVAGTIHRHHEAIVSDGAAKRDRPIIRVTTSSCIPRPSRRAPSHNHQHANSSQSQQGPVHSDNLELGWERTTDPQQKAYRFLFGTTVREDRVC